MVAAQLEVALNAMINSGNVHWDSISEEGLRAAASMTCASAIHCIK